MVRCENSLESKWAGTAAIPTQEEQCGSGKAAVTVTPGPGLGSTECVLLENCSSRRKRWISGGKWGLEVSVLVSHSPCASRVSAALLPGCTGSREPVEARYQSVQGLGTEQLSQSRDSSHL